MTLQGRWSQPQNPGVKRKHGGVETAPRPPAGPKGPARPLSQSAHTRVSQQGEAKTTATSIIYSFSPNKNNNKPIPLPPQPQRCPLSTGVTLGQPRTALESCLQWAMAPPGAQMGFSYQAWLPLGLRVLINPVPTSWTGDCEGVHRGSRRALEEPHIHSEAQGDSGLLSQCWTLGVRAFHFPAGPPGTNRGKACLGEVKI